MEDKKENERIKNIVLSNPHTLNFAERPSLSAHPTGKKTKLITNYFTISMRFSNYIYVYSVKFEEEIPDENTYLKMKILRGICGSLSPVFKYYFFTGTLLYSTQDIGTEPFKVETAEFGEKYIVEFLQSFVISLQDIKTPHKNIKKAQTVSTFLNVALKNLLFSLNMIPLGKTGKYLLQNEAVQLSHFDISIWPGYKTSVRYCDAGLVLEVDYVSKILQQKTVYQFLQEKREEAGQQGSNYQTEVKEALYKKSVMAWYGNKRFYVVTDIDFTKDPTTYYFVTTDGNVNIDQYFWKKYGIMIKDKKQPLIVSAKTNKDNVEIKTYLVPELCGLTGLPENLINDHTTMKQVAKYTKLTPEDRTKRMQNLLKQFTRMDINSTPQQNEEERKINHSLPGQIIKDWGFDIELKSHEVEGRILPPISIRLGNNQIAGVPPSGQFLFKQKICNPIALKKWILVHASFDKKIAENFVETLYKAANVFEIEVEYPKYEESNGIRAADFIDAAMKSLCVLENPDIIVFILPPTAIDEYKHIKRWAITQKMPILTQMIKTKTLQMEKALMAVCNKVILQINAKRNGDLWRVSISKECSKKNNVYWN